MRQLLEGPHTILCHHCSCCLPFLGSGGFGGFPYDPGTLVTLTVLCLGRARCSFLSSGLQAPVCSDSALLPLQHSGMTSARAASLTHAPISCLCFFLSWWCLHDSLPGGVCPESSPPVFSPGGGAVLCASPRSACLFQDR